MLMFAALTIAGFKNNDGKISNALLLQNWHRSKIVKANTSWPLIRFSAVARP
jgi:hypothetical protein